MSYVPGYEYDLFISYAYVDNEPVPSSKHGWVDTLIQVLTSGCGLGGKLGRQDAFTWWIDKQHLRGNDELSSHIPEQVKNSALFLVVLSPGYVASKFCLLELQTFLESAGHAPGRIFVVNREPIVERRHSVPEALRMLRKYQFWERDKNNKPRILGWPQPISSNPDDRIYFQRIEDVCQDIADKLDDMRIQAAAAGGVGPSFPATRPMPGQRRTGETEVARVGGDRRPTVLLAETTDDLLRKRDEVRRYLEQAGVLVLPTGTYYGLSAADFEKALSGDLADCAAFVQLLGPELGRSVDGADDGFGWLQLNVARRAKRPILQWRSLDLTDLRSVQDPKQKELLQAADAMPIEEFKLKIVRSLAERKVKAVRPSFVFINCDAVDVTEADSIGSHLGGNIDWQRPAFEDKPKAKVLQENIEAGVVDCDGLLIVHAKSPVGWVKAQLQLYRKLRQRRTKDPRVLAVVQSASAQQLKGVGLVGLKIIGVNDVRGILQPEFQP